MGPVEFTARFNLPRSATDITARLDINADNAYRVSLNGHLIGGDGFMTMTPPFDDGGWAQIEHFTVTPQPGMNTLTVRAFNYDGNGFPFNDPAGVIWRLRAQMTVGA
jgi:hypothetical protein